MKKAKFLLTLICILLFVNQLSSQQWVLLVEKVKNKKEHIIKPGDKVRLYIKKKNGKITGAVAIISSIDKENLYIEPVKKRFPNQSISIPDLKYIGIKTPGSRTAGCFLFFLNILSKGGSGDANGIFKNIRFDKGKWEKNVIVRVN
jgi:hypothetical protein